MKARWAVIALLALLVGVFHILLFSNYPGQRLEPVALDLWFNLRGKIDSPQDVVIVAMNEKSYSNLGVPLNQAWPRGLHAELLERLAEYEVKGAVFDILFLDPGIDAEQDKRLAAAIAKVPTYLGIEASSRIVQGMGGSYTLEELLTPYKPFMEAAAGVGLVGQLEDFGQIRRFFVARTEQSTQYPSLAEAGASLIRPIKEMPGERDFVRYYGPARSITTFSYDDVLQTEKPLPKQFFKDKLVYVGLVLRTEMGPAQKDVFGSPFYGQLIFGTEVHATAASNLIDQFWIHRSSGLTEGAILFVVTVLISSAIFFLSPLWAGLVTASTIVSWLIISYLSFLNGLFIPGFLLCVVVLPLSYLGSTLYYYFVTRRSAQQIQAAFELYLSPEMAQQMSQKVSSLSLGGEKLWATALFTDISDFTSITEEMPAEKVSAMLNAYFTEVMDVILENQGTLIKFIGDAVFVIWGAPIRINNHAELAIKTALALQVECKRFNESGRFPRLETRIGINTGPMVVGNLGSERRFDYTAIGDSVNLASRVEGLNKYFGTDILFTESTKKEIGNIIPSTLIANVQVSGKKEIVSLFTSFTDSIAPAAESAWLGACSSFAGRKWDEAEAAFKEVALREPRLKVACEYYLEELSNHRSNPPVSTWQGEILFVTK